jgi:FkbM family methyltransferase
VQESAELLEEEFFTTNELRDRLGSLAASDDAGFVDGIYRILLGRAPEAGAVAGNTARLGEVSRRQLIAEVAGSLEASRRGIDLAIVDAVAAEVPELQTVPARPASMLQRLERVPGGSRARHVGKRLLRDPNVGTIGRQVAELRDALRSYGQFSQMAARESALQIDRLNAEVRGLSDALDELRAGITAEAPGGLRHALSTELGALSKEFAAKPGTHGTYLGDGRIMVALTWGGSLLVPADDLSLTPELVTHGIYEPAFTHYLMRTLKPGMRAIDVGANVGMHTILMAGWVGTEGHVLAYEPNPDVLSFLRANVALNWVNERVTIRDAGIGGTAGRTTLFVTEQFMGNSSLLRPDEQYFANVPMDTVREVEIDVVTLDQEAESFGHIDLIKVDVEGAECSVMKGMTGLIDAGRIDRVCFEVYRDRMGDDWGEFSGLLRRHARHGWHFHDIASDGSLTGLDLEKLLEVGRYSQVAMCRVDGDD